MYSYNPYYANYLMHYGTATSGRYPKGSGARPYQHVPGMIRRLRGHAAANRAIEYAKDINQHRYNDKIRQIKADKYTGEITKDEYKSLKKEFKQEKKAANIKDISEIIQSKKNITADQSKKISEIYQKYKDTAYSEIPHYLAKRGLRTAGRIGASALIGMTVGYITGKSYAITKGINDMSWTHKVHGIDPISKRAIRGRVYEIWPGAIANLSVASITGAAVITKTTSAAAKKKM